MASPYFGSFLVGELPPTGEVGWMDLGDAMWLSAVARDNGEPPLAQLSAGSASAVTALQETRSIADALSPFASALAASGRLAATKPLSVALIVDGGASMAVWQPMTVAFRTVLARSGYFHEVRSFVLLPAADSAGSPTPEHDAPSVRRRHPARLLDQSHQQIFLVLTDGTGGLWRDPNLNGLLGLWGQSGPLAIVNPYPQRYWHRSGVRPRRVRLSAPAPMSANDRLDVRTPGDDPFDTSLGRLPVPVPMIELSPRWIGWWASLLCQPEDWVDALICRGGDEVAAEETPGQPRPQTPEQLVLSYRKSASAQAFQLATCLAAAPLDPPLVRHVQRVMLPSSARHHLAEVINSNLVRRTEDAARPVEFAEGVRAALLTGTSRDASAQVVRAVAEYYGQRNPVAAALARTIDTVDADLEGTVSRDTLPMARIALVVLTAWSGPYAALAHRLGGAIGAVERAHRREDVSGRIRSEPRRRARTAGRVRRDEDAAEEARPGVWGGVPPRNLEFTGRRALLAGLARQLRTESVVAVLPGPYRGMGGVGKSQIASEYVYRHGAEYDVVWWIPAEQPAQVPASLIELGDALGLKVGKEVTAASRVLEALWAGTPYSNWLLVFDNAESLPAVRDYLPRWGTGKALVTSRNADWEELARTVRIGPFTRAESVQLLRKRNRRLSPEDADRLAAALGDLPLAIEHASAWLVTTRTEVGEYLAMLTRKRTELRALVPAPGYEMPVAAAANVALDRLAGENPAALQLLQVCSFFAAEPIGRDIFEKPRAAVVPELDEALQRPDKLDQALRDIQRYVLARVDHRTGTLQLHRLVRTVLQSSIPTDRRSRMEHGAHLFLTNTGAGDPSDTRNWLVYHTLASHLAESNAIACDDHWVRELVLRLIAFRYYWGDYDSCRSLAKTVVDLWQRTLGPEADQTLRAGKWLWFVSRVLGDVVAAARISGACLDIYRRTVGPNDAGTIDAMLQVAHDRRVAGRFAEALRLDRDAFDRLRDAFPAGPDTWRAAHSLGVSQLLTGDLRGARQRHEDTFHRRRDTLGANHPETLRTENNLIVDERECGEYRTARRAAESLYQRYLNLFGTEHPETITVARNLAIALRRAGDHNAAYKLSQDTVHRFGRRFGSTHYEAIAAAVGLAIDARENNELRRAHDLAEQSVEQYRMMLGPDHPYTSYVRTNLSVVLRLLRQPEDAYGHSRAAWTTLTRLLGPDHVITLVCAVNMASDLAAVGAHQDAYDLGLDSLHRLRRSAGSEHPTTSACALNLALDLAALGRAGESSALLRQARDAYVRVLGGGHPQTIAAASEVRANCDADPMPF
jgi:hypothetical protein